MEIGELYKAKSRVNNHHYDGNLFGYFWGISETESDVLKTENEVKLSLDDIVLCVSNITTKQYFIYHEPFYLKGYVVLCSSNQRKVFIEDFNERLFEKISCNKNL